MHAESPASRRARTAAAACAAVRVMGVASSGLAEVRSSTAGREEAVHSSTARNECRCRRAAHKKPELPMLQAPGSASTQSSGHSQAQMAPTHLPAPLGGGQGRTFPSCRVGCLPWTAAAPPAAAAAAPCWQTCQVAYACQAAARRASSRASGQAAAWRLTAAGAWAAGAWLALRSPWAARGRRLLQAVGAAASSLAALQRWRGAARAAAWVLPRSAGKGTTRRREGEWREREGGICQASRQAFRESNSMQLQSVSVVGAARSAAVQNASQPAQPSRAHHWHSWRHGHASWHAARHRRPHLGEGDAGARLLREEHAWPPSLHQYGNRGAGRGRQSSNAERNQRPALIWLRDGLEAPTANGGHQDAREEAGCGPGAAPPPTCAGTANPAPGRAMTAAWDPPGGLPGGPGPAGSGGVGRGAEGSGGWSDTHSSSGRRRWARTRGGAPHPLLHPPRIKLSGRTLGVYGP